MKKFVRREANDRGDSVHTDSDRKSTNPSINCTGKYTCSACGRQVRFRESFPSELPYGTNMMLGDYYTEHADINRYYSFNSVCPKCGKEDTVNIAVRHSQFVDVVVGEKDLRPIESYYNIDAAYQRRLQYNAKCKKRLGSEDREDIMIANLGNYKPGDVIEVLNTPWVIDEIYTEEHDHKNFTNIHERNYVFLVHYKKTKRIINYRSSNWFQGKEFAVYKADFSHAHDKVQKKSDYEYYHIPSYMKLVKKECPYPVVSVLSIDKTIKKESNAKK